LLVRFRNEEFIPKPALNQEAIMKENMTSEPLTVDQIRSQMRQFRREFESGVDQFVFSTHSLTDWKQYVASRPLLAFAVCAIAGSALIPKRKHNHSPNQKEIADLVRREKLVVASPNRVKNSGGLLSGAVAAVARIGLQTATGVAMQKFGAAMGRTTNEGEPS
jgi:hypothetical protein